VLLIFTVIGLISWIGIGLYYSELKHLETIKNNVAKNNVLIPLTSSPENYDSLCNIENRKGIYFPNKNVSCAKLTKNDFWKETTKISGEKLEVLLTLLNDSSSYDWGELGTPEIHYYITFFDQKDKCIGLTTIDLEGMAYSYPCTAHMKWGMIKKMDLIDQIIFE